MPKVSPFFRVGLACLLLTCFFGSGCSLRRYALNKVADALAQSGTTFSSDDDPELVKVAAPFSLKLMESLLAGNPRHTRLLAAATSGFTEYAFAFVQEEADEIEPTNLAVPIGRHGEIVKSGASDFKPSRTVALSFRSGTSTEDCPDRSMIATCAPPDRCRTRDLLSAA